MAPHAVKVGDILTRLISSDYIPMRVQVAKIDDTLIYCRPVGEDFADWNPEDCWRFDRVKGYEVDPDFGWGEPGPDGAIVTGSVLRFAENGSETKAGLDNSAKAS